jgi:hypothetical protein
LDRTKSLFFRALLRLWVESDHEAETVRMNRASRWLCAALVAVPGLAASVPAVGFSLQGTHWDRVAREASCQLDAYMLYAVALAESGRRTGNGVAPHPWTTNRAGDARYFDSFEAAAAYLRELCDRCNVDIGFMQVNLWHHRHRVDDPEDLLNRDTNLRVGAQILCEALAEQGDLVRGFGRYHSARPEHKRPYGVDRRGIGTP